MASTTYDLFFTGRDDPRSCVIIGEDTKPIYFAFETAERNLLTPNVRTMVGPYFVLARIADKLQAIYLEFYRFIRIIRRCALSSNGVLGTTWAAQPLGIANFQCRNWSLQGHPAGNTPSISSAEVKLTDMGNPDIYPSARAFVSSEGKRFEWRRNRDNPTSYDVRIDMLSSSRPSTEIYAQLYASHNTRIAVFRRYTQATVIGPSHAVLQYSFTQDSLLVEALVALCVTRWVDLHGV